VTPVIHVNYLTVFCGDALAVLKTMPSESVQCVVTSPPYDNLRTYGGQPDFTWEIFTGIARELFRVLVPGGVCCWNVADQVIDGSESMTSFRQGLYFATDAGFLMHDRMIYERGNFSHPERVRYHQLFEDIFILSKGPPRAFNPIKDKPNIYAGSGTYGENTARQPDGSMKLRTRNIISEFGMRGNVWRGKTRGQEEICEKLPHPAMMPKWLAHDLILSWSNSGDVVLDPMAGSGTTGEMALALGRKAVLIERNSDYIPLIEQSNTQRGFAIADSPPPPAEPTTPEIATPTLFDLHNV
jgi:DNA modification methylase